MQIDVPPGRASLYLQEIDAQGVVRATSAVGPFRVEYDAEDDILYLTVGEPKESTTESLDNTVYVRTDPETGALHGIEIWHYSKLRGGHD